MTLKNRQDKWSESAKDLYHMRMRNGKVTHFGPDPTEIEIHERTLRKIINKNKKIGKETTVLVLGATPELRDLALHCGCYIYCVDMNKNVLYAASKHLQEKDRSGEKVFVGNWDNLNMIEDDEIDFILGSASINNLPLESFSDVFKELNRILNKEGIIQLRHITFPDKQKEDYSFTNVLKNYRHKKISDREFYVILRFYSFLDIAYDNDKHVLYAKKVFDEFDRQFSKGILKKEEAKYLTSFRNKVEHTIFSQNEMISIFTNSFSDCRILHGNGECYFKDIYNIFEMGSRK